MSDLMDKYRDADQEKEREKEGGAMSRSFIIGITMLVLLCVILLCSSVALFIIRQNEVEKRVLLNKQLEDMANERDRLMVELEKVKSVKSEIELKLVLKEKEVQNLHEKFELVRVQRSLVEGDKSTIAAELSSLKEDYLALKDDFEQLQKAKGILEQKLKDFAHSGVKLKTIIVEPEWAGKPEEVQTTEETVVNTIEGEVLAVNKEYEFLVVNLGMKNGITEDSEISIYKGSELIAIAHVEKLYDNISAVIVNDRGRLNDIKVGDIAIGTVKGNR